MPTATPSSPQAQARTYLVKLVATSTGGYWRKANETVHGGPISRDNAFLVNQGLLGDLPEEIGQESGPFQHGAFRHTLERVS